MKQMSKVLGNRTRMLKTVLLFLTEFASTLSGIVVIAATKLKIKEKTDAIDDLQVKNNTISEGVAKDKEKKKENMCDDADLVAGLGFSYANDLKDDILGAKFNQTGPKLLAMKDESSADACQTIYNNADLLSVELLPLGVTPEVMEHFQGTIDLFKGKEGAGTKALGDINSNIKKQNKLAVEGMAICDNQLDKQMKNFKSDDLLMAKYKSARRILDLGTRKSAVTGVGVNENGEPIYGLKIRVVELNLEDYSDIEGNFGIYTKTGGVFTVEASHDLFVTQTKTLVEVKVGKATKVNFMMVSNIVTETGTLEGFTTLAGAIAGGYFVSVGALNGTSMATGYYNIPSVPVGLNDVTAKSPNPMVPSKTKSINITQNGPNKLNFDF